MRILWCHEVSYTGKPVYEYQDFAERLSARGHQIEVLDFDESSPTKAESLAVSRTGEAEVLRTPIPHGGMPGFKYLEAQARFYRMLRKRLKVGSVDVVFVYSVFINGALAVQISRKFGVPVVYRVLDAYHQLRPGRLTRAILLAGERYIYRNADRILVTNEKMADYVTGLASPRRAASMRVLDHGVDCAHFTVRPRDRELAERYAIEEDDQVAVFLGTTYAFSGLLELVRRMSDAICRSPRLKLLIVGAGELDDALASAVGALGLDGKVILTGMVSYQDVPRYLSLGTIALNPFEINDITRDIVPIKILQYQACGLPVLSTPLPDLKRKHPPGGAGVRYSATADIGTFVSELTEMLGAAEEMSALAVRGRHYMECAFSVERAIDTLESELETLVGAARGAGSHAAGALK